ncbi:uncharacterized protein J7T54_005470 [Emericellopsis cladophorae]|uniref:Gastric mucin-like protein n=1 Tax=Emericellopsis cladophorae TaxID=2686198 RepID=A0A9Q0BCI4_9HYPO|nr:uncharacterized protein J7T54_005470 [Emericellopsis cladophorae]KAI6780367.1 hypothetical protein J7T54_005470 [Emericellopsis cladophorae]
MAPSSMLKPMGSIVAFEGHPETVSTQLRLLPTSPHILILPSVQCYLSTTDDDAFAAPDYIRKVHHAANARYNAAQAFLEGSTASSKRLVFMNGGTPSAQALCIRQIMRYETQGDHVEAESMFHHLVKEGLGGLQRQARIWASGQADGGSRSSPFTMDTTILEYETPEALSEDPITRAMRAAEALDRETANLQPSTELDLTLTSRRRSHSLPMYGYTDNFGDAAPFYVFGARKRANSDTSVADEAVEDDSPKAGPPRFSVTHFEQGAFDQPMDSPVLDPELSPSCVGESYGPTATFLHSPLLDALPTSRSEAFDIRSPGQLTFGEASVVDVRQTIAPVTRVRSLDGLWSSPSTGNEDSTSALRPLSCSTVTEQQPLPSLRSRFAAASRTISVRTRHASVVSLSPVPPERKRRIKRLAYVDRGTNAEVIEEPAEVFVPVHPLTEHLVVYMKDDAPDALLDTAIRAFRDGLYPILASRNAGSDTATINDELPSTPESHSIRGGDETPKATEEPSIVKSPSIGQGEYDPFAYIQDTWPTSKTTERVVAKVHRPPTPRKTPTPSVLTERDNSFHEFKVCTSHTAVAIQNELRSVLESYFPPESDGYKQFSFSLLPELEALWKPIFREAEPGSPRADNRRMDQILAIGSQKGVKKEYSSAVVGLLDKLGTKRSGTSRSGRLDFRYLLANAMQSFTNQPMANQTSDNPFNNAYLLATLIVPHLETYLAMHAEVRYLLLEYPPEHLSTILALQKLVGVDLMKVAQLIDSESSDMARFMHLRGASISSQVQSQGPLGKPVGSTSETDIAVPHANFLLTPSASDTELATFIATIRKILMSISQYYAPEEPLQPPTPPSKPSAAKQKPTPLSGSFPPFPRSTRPPSPITPGFSKSAKPSDAPSTRADSIAETVRTFKTSRTGKNPKSKRGPAMTDGAESIMTYDPAGDSDYDEEERRLMPIFIQKRSQMQKPNSHKALKFLGLA